MVAAAPRPVKEGIVWFPGEVVGVERGRGWALAARSSLVEVEARSGPAVRR